jgi:lysophospholipase L1-like esterase/pimeloyl-ACP methyl ester carboxylesterase
MKLKKTVMKYLITLLLGFSGLIARAQVKVACIGASITYGARITDREQNSYPAQLQKMLGNKYQVENYGVSGCTLLRNGDMPYWHTKQYRDALAYNPDVVIIDLGGNDSKLVNRIHIDEFEKDYADFIRSFAQLPSRPRIILLLAMPSFVKDTTGIWNTEIVKKINPRIQNVAFAEQVEVIDMHSPFINKEANMPDKIHPDKAGATIMAQNVHRVIAQNRDRDFNIFNNLHVPIQQSSFYGYACADFIYNGRACKIAKPKIAAKGHPWLWRARFWGHEPQTDIALLQQGFHIVYCDVAEMLGNSEAIADWDNYYRLLRKAGLGKKAVFEGMSRGGVYVFNWAAVNPDKVACVYVDNPLLNFPAWAAQFTHKSDVKDAMFLAFKKDFNLVSDEDVLNFKGSPVDKVKQIVKGKYPILILCADEDEAVSPRENTLLFEQKVKELNGNITVIHKPGFKHHPHSLPNPAPIVDFILKATGYNI